MKAGDKDPGTFFLAFVGQHVIITLDVMSSVTDGTVTESLPVFYEGILLDFDQESFYLGETPNQITQEIPRNRRINVRLSNDDEVTKEFLNQIPRPENESEIN